MGYVISTRFEFPNAQSKADAEEIFWKAVRAGDVEELKECCGNFKVIKDENLEGGSMGNVLKTQVNELFFGTRQKPKSSNGQR